MFIIYFFRRTEPAIFKSPKKFELKSPNSMFQANVAHGFRVLFSWLQDYSLSILLFNQFFPRPFSGPANFENIGMRRFRSQSPPPPFPPILNILRTNFLISLFFYHLFLLTCHIYIIKLFVCRLRYISCKPCIEIFIWNTLFVT